jgi:hypothetical protein
MAVVRNYLGSINLEHDEFIVEAINEMGENVSETICVRSGVWNVYGWMEEHSYLVSGIDLVHDSFHVKEPQLLKQYEDIPIQEYIGIFSGLVGVGTITWDKLAYESQLLVFENDWGSTSIDKLANENYVLVLNDTVVVKTNSTQVRHYRLGTEKDTVLLRWCLEPIN